MRIWQSALAIALVFSIQVTAAAAPPQVLLDVTPPDSAIVPLLRAELRELGIEVVEGSSGAAVTMHIVLTSESLEVRVVDQATGRTTVRETFPAVTGSPMDPRTAVLHAVELLRWDLRFAPPPTVTPKPTPAIESTPAPPPAASNMRVGITSLALYSPGGAGIGAGGQVDILKRWGRLGARALGGTVLLPNAMSVPEGSIEVTARWGGLAGVLIVEGDRRTSLEVGAGATIFASALHGKASGENMAADDHLLTAAPFGELRLRQRITPGFALDLGAMCLVPLKSSRLRVLGAEVGRFGQAVVTLGLGVELTLF